MITLSDSASAVLWPRGGINGNRTLGRPGMVDALAPGLYSLAILPSYAPTRTDRLSFTCTLRLVRRQVSAQAGFPPDRSAHALAEGAVEILARLLPFRRRRRNRRVVKRKMSNFAPKRSGRQG